MNHLSFYPKLKIIVTFVILLCLFTLVSAISYVDAVSSNLSSSVFRLHVIANSDSREDQELKYIVRDGILDYVQTITSPSHSKQEVIAIINNHQKEIQRIAEAIVQENGFDYTVSIEIGNYSFPTKTYGDISFPAGFYDALRVKIGNASGQNWWCVMFPPLCFVDVSSGVVPQDSKEIIQENLSEEEFAIISHSEEENDEIHFKFKLIEFFQNFSIQTAKK